MGITKELLQKLYWDDGLSTRAIAKELGCSQATVHRKMVGFNIPRRGYEDNPTPVKKGQPMPEHHRRAISQAHKKLVAQGKRRYDGKHSPAWKGGKITVYCAICGEPIKVWPCRIERTGQFACPKKCFGKLQSALRQGERTEYVDIPCDYCGTPLHIRKKLFESAKTGLVFCDNHCSGQWKRENWTGSNSPNWKGGYAPYYGQNWEDQRLLALKRDGHTCQVCGKTKAEEGQQLSVHHIVPFREFGRKRYKEANQLANLITLCNQCHGQQERH